LGAYVGRDLWFKDGGIVLIGSCGFFKRDDFERRRIK